MDLPGLKAQSIIHRGQGNHETWSDRSPSPDCPLRVGDSCVSGSSRHCSHITVIVCSPTGRLSSSATSHHAQPCHALTAQPWPRWHRPGHSFQHRKRRWMHPWILPDVFRILTEAREGWGRKRRGLFPLTRGAVSWEIAWLIGNEGRQRAGSAEVNS